MYLTINEKGIFKKFSKGHGKIVQVVKRNE